MPPDLASEFDERGDSAALRPSEPSVQFLFRELRILQLENEAQLLLQVVSAPDLRVFGLDQLQPFLLALRKVLGILAERILRPLDLVDLLPLAPDFLLDFPVVRDALLLVLPHHLGQLLAGATPGVDAHRAERVVRPLDDVERVEAPRGVRAVFRHRVRDPPRAVAGDETD